MMTTFWLQLLACEGDSGIKVHNDPPTITILSHEDGSTITAQEVIELRAQAADLNHTSSELQVTWLVDNQVVCPTAPALEDGTSVCSTSLNSGASQIQAEVIDPKGSAASDIIQVSVASNGPPTEPTVRILPEAPTTLNDLTVEVSGATDPDGDTISYQFTWYQEDQEYGNSENIPAEATSRGESWKVVVQASDGENLSAEVQAQTLIVNSAPQIVNPSLSPSPLYNDSLANCSASAFDPDNDTTSLTYSWTINGNQIATGEEAIINPQQATPNDTVTCIIVAEDSEGAQNTEEVSSTIINRPPVINELNLSPEIVYTNDIISAQITHVDQDGEDVELVIDWVVDGQTVLSNSTELDGLMYFSRDQLVEIQVTPSDPWGNGATVTESLIIANSLPTAPSLSITPSSPTEGEDDLICVIDSPSIDADGDVIEYSFSWSVDGNSYGGTPFETNYPDDSISKSETTAGQVWECSVTPDDGTQAGGIATLESGTVQSCMVEVQVYVQQTCTGYTSQTNYGRHASCGVNGSCVWCCNQDYIDPDCEGWCYTANGDTPCPSWHAEYYNECTYTETVPYDYDCSYTTTEWQPC